MTMASGADSSRAAKMSLAATHRLLIAFPLDGDGDHTGDRLEKIDVLQSEAPLLAAVSAEKAERARVAGNNHSDAADNFVIHQELRWLERQVLPQSSIITWRLLSRA